MFQGRNTAVHQRDVAAALKLATVSTVLTLLAIPASAAPSIPVPCKEAKEVTLHVSDAALVSDVVNHNVVAKTPVSASASVLAPRAKAAIDEAFEASAAEALTTAQPELAKSVLGLPMAGTETAPRPDDRTEDAVMPSSEMNTKLPGISDDDLVRYKKQMYRRDI